VGRGILYSSIDNSGEGRKSESPTRRRERGGEEKQNATFFRFFFSSANIPASIALFHDKEKKPKTRQKRGQRKHKSGRTNINKQAKQTRCTLKQ
jgi:hypothetical protein